jgi:hypothetical protein
MDTPEHTVADWQRRFFRVLDDFFRELHGCGIDGVPPEVGYPAWAKTQVSRMRKTGDSAYNRLMASLEGLYGESKERNFLELAGHLGGLKVVLGGSSHFGSSKLGSIKRMALYADTIFVPDPVLPWIEVTRSEHRFGHVHMMESLYYLLNLKPLVDAELAYPAIVVFPSWEKTLELEDKHTIDAQRALVTGVLSDQLGHEFGDYDEVAVFARDHPDRFLQELAKHRVFVGPDSEPGDDLMEGIRAYRRQVEALRSAEHSKQLLSLPDSALALAGVTERIAPVFHLLENAEMLVANPMMATSVHWHYYHLSARYFESRLTALGLLDEHVLDEIDGLDSSSLGWLGDIPIPDLAWLRLRGENETFRDRLREATDSLQRAPIKDINRVAAQMSQAISSLIQQHQREIGEIQEKYDRGHIQTALLAGVTAAATMFPALAPLTGLPLLVPAGKFTWDLLSKHFEVRDASRSLMGVLATTKAKAAR